MRDTGGASASLDTQLGNRCRNGEHIILELRMRSSTRNRVAQVAPRATLGLRCLDAPGRVDPWLGPPSHRCASATAASLVLVVSS